MQYPLYPDQKLALSNYLFLSDILVVEDVGTDYIYYELLYIYIYLLFTNSVWILPFVAQGMTFSHLTVVLLLLFC